MEVTRRSWLLPRRASRLHRPALRCRLAATIVMRARPRSCIELPPFLPPLASARNKARVRRRRSKRCPAGDGQYAAPGGGDPPPGSVDARRVRLNVQSSRQCLLSGQDGKRTGPSDRTSLSARRPMRVRGSMPRLRARRCSPTVDWRDPARLGLHHRPSVLPDRSVLPTRRSGQRRGSRGRFECKLHKPHRHLL